VIPNPLPRAELLQLRGFRLPLISNVDPTLKQSIEAKAREVVEHVDRSLGGAPSEQQLREAAESLCILARLPAWESSEYREASSNEELIYELAVGPSGGPALYLVSDGASISSKPHRHDTWAVIVGIRGHEVNHLYHQQSEPQKAVTRSSQIEVGPYSVLVLHEQDIHSTEVRGTGPTFHLHLYGRALHALPSFSCRCYSVASEV
jgi:predicted metal-dependent enzyme (double-stranded beta helix superfamily)